MYRKNGSRKDTFANIVDLNAFRTQNKSPRKTAAPDRFTQADKYRCLDMMGLSSERDLRLTALLEMPDVLYVLEDGNYAPLTLSTKPNSDILKIVGFFSTGSIEKFPDISIEYGLDIRDKGSNVYCTLFDDRRRIVVISHIGSYYTDKLDWDRVAYDIETAQEMAAKEKTNEGFQLLAIDDKARFIIKTDGSKLLI